METGLQKEEYRERFSEVLLFRALAPDARAFLYDRSEVLFFDAGRVIVKEGDKSPSFYAVLDGSVSVEVLQEGKSVYICTLGLGAVFGEAAMFLKSARTATVRALDPSAIVRIDREAWMDFLRKFPREGNKALLSIVYGLLSKLRSANQELAFERRGDSQQAEIDALVAELGG